MAESAQKYLFQKYLPPPFPGDYIVLSLLELYKRNVFANIAIINLDYLWCCCSVVWQVAVVVPTHAWIAAHVCPQITAAPFGVNANLGSQDINVGVSMLHEHLIQV